MRLRLLLCIGGLALLVVGCSGSEATITPSPTTAIVPSETAAIPPTETTAPSETVTTEPTEAPTTAPSETPTQQSLSTDDTSCPVLVEDTLASLDTVCAGTGRNQICYGNVRLTVERESGATSLRFEQPGDIIDLAEIRQVQLAPMNLGAHEWGVALLKVQASIPDTLPGQNVTMLLFGDVELRNGTIPGQAFYFKTGTSRAACAEAPQDGVLVQTPAGVGKVSFAMNNVEFELGSTAYLQAEAGQQMAVTVLEGRADVTAAGVTQVVRAGTFTTLPLDADANPSGPPEPPQPYDAEPLRALPLSSLERPVYVAGLVLSSDFVSDDEGWMVSGESSGLLHDAAGFICSSANPPAGVWYYTAPEAWLGDRSVVYGGTLNYEIRQGPTDEERSDLFDVSLEGAGTAIYYKAPRLPAADWTSIRVPLAEGSGWYNREQQAVTRSQFQAVLQDLSGLLIRGHYYVGETPGCLDSVQLIRPIVPLRAAPSRVVGLPIDLEVSDRLEQPGAPKGYTFEAAAGQTVYFDWIEGESPYLMWQLFDPSERRIFRSQGNDERQELPLDGTYTLEVSGAQDDTIGAYRFKLWNVPPPDEFDALISPEAPYQGAGLIESPGVLDLYRFTASAGDQIYLDWLGADSVYISWRLFDPAGQRLFQGLGGDQRLGGDRSQGLPLDGEYTLEVYGYRETVGAYRFQIWHVPPPDEFALTLREDTPYENSGAIETPGVVDVYRFSALPRARRERSSGEPLETVYFEWLEAESVYLSWRLFGPDGERLFQGLGGDQRQELHQEGEYTLEVYGYQDAVGSYSLRLWLIPAPDEFNVTLRDDAPYEGSGTIETPGVLDIYRFAGRADESIYFEWLEAENVYLSWRLFGPDGERLFQGLGGDQRLELTLEGEYTLEVYGYQNATGAYRMRIWRVAATDEYEVQFSADEPYEGSGALETPGAVDRYRVTARAGDTLYFHWLEGDLNAFYQLIDPAGEQLFSQYGGSWRHDVSADGEYTVEIRGYRNASGAYRFQLWNQPEPEPVAVDFSQAIQGEISVPGQINRYTFIGQAGRTLRFSWASRSSGFIHWELLGPDGQRLFAGGTQQEIRLPSAGEYTLQVSGQLFNVGEYVIEISMEAGR